MDSTRFEGLGFGMGRDLARRGTDEISGYRQAIEGIDGVEGLGFNGDPRHDLPKVIEVSARGRKAIDKHATALKAIHDELVKDEAHLTDLEKRLTAWEKKHGGKLPDGVHDTGMGPVHRYLAPISTGPLAVPPSSSITFQVNIQRLFRIERLVMQSSDTGGSIASQLTIDQFTVGATPQLAVAGSVPIALFSPQAIATSLRGDSALPGKTITLTISNPGIAPINVTGAFLGESADT